MEEEEEGSSAHFWDPKMFTTVRGYEYKCTRILRQIIHDNKI
jgi:hypothetical protein